MLGGKPVSTVCGRTVRALLNVCERRRDALIFLPSYYTPQQEKSPWDNHPTKFWSGQSRFS